MMMSMMMIMVTMVTIMISFGCAGLLSSHGTMNLERLHTLLKLLSGGGVSGGAVSDMHFDMSLPELRQYLQSQVDQHKIELIDGVYSLCK